MTLSEIMHVHVPTLSPDSTVRDAIDKMDIYQFPALVIVDAHRVPIAVITEGDIVRAATLKGDITGLASRKVLDIATRDPLTADAQMEVGDALHLMISKGLTILPCMAGGKLSGIALRVDLMQALLMDVASPAVEG